MFYDLSVWSPVVVSLPITYCSISFTTSFEVLWHLRMSFLKFRGVIIRDVQIRSRDRGRSRDFQKIGIGRKKSGIGNFYKIFLLFYWMLQNKNDHVHVLKSSWGLSFDLKLHNIMYVLLISLKSGNRVGAVSNSSSKLTRGYVQLVPRESGQRKCQEFGSIIKLKAKAV